MDISNDCRNFSECIDIEITTKF